MQIKNIVTTPRQITFEYDNGLFGRLSFYNEAIVRYQVSPTATFSDTPSIAATVDIPSGDDATVATGGAGQILKEMIIETPQSIAVTPTERGFKSALYEVVIDAVTPAIQILDAAGKIICWQKGQPNQTADKKHLGMILNSTPDDYFYGGGTQNGLVSLKGRTIKIENQNEWTEGGVASPVPFFSSTQGYGVVFNTFTPGTYSFSFPRSISLKHEDTKLDAYIILAPTIPEIISGYHTLTGKPLFAPLYTYYPAHLNAYNRDYWVEVTADSPTAIMFSDGKYYKEYQPIREKTFNTGFRPGTIEIDGVKLVPNVGLPGKVTFVDADENGNPRSAVRESLNGEKNNYQFSARAVVDNYATHDLPLGWFLPNDGYGAGYGQTETLAGDLENLAEFGKYARDHGVELGLWTQENLAPVNPDAPQKDDRDLQAEVAQAGVAALKTDVAWVGEGYTFGLNGIGDAAKKMRAFGQKRPFILTLDGWAGTQRYGAIWSGDQEGGDWQNIKFHIPTYLSTGLSGNHNVGADMDGIFGGNNPIIETRDIQWKSFTPIQLSMDGWGFKPRDLGTKFGAEFLDINRFYLKLKTRLLAYLYSTAHVAYDTGLPVIRPTFLAEATPFTHGDSLNQQFLLGDNFLIAPVFENYHMDDAGNDTRNGIYLPAGSDWIDYFTGVKYAGGQMLANFAAPLWKLPVFVKTGAILPLLNASNQPRDIDHTQAEFQIFPGAASTFTTFEDDGISRAYENGAGLVQTISQVSDEIAMTVTFAPASGTYDGAITTRDLTVDIYLEEAPNDILINVQSTTDFIYKEITLDTFAPADSTSAFAAKTISQGNFAVIQIPAYNMYEALTITVIK